MCALFLRCQFGFSHRGIRFCALGIAVMLSRLALRNSNTVYVRFSLGRHFIDIKLLPAHEFTGNTCCMYTACRSICKRVHSVHTYSKRVHSAYKPSVWTSPDWSDSNPAPQTPGLGGPLAVWVALLPTDNDALLATLQPRGGQAMIVMFKMFQFLSWPALFALPGRHAPAPRHRKSFSKVRCLGHAPKEQ